MNCHSTHLSQHFPLQQVVIHLFIFPAGVGFPISVNLLGHGHVNPECTGWWPQHAVSAKCLLQEPVDFYAALSSCE